MSQPQPPPPDSANEQQQQQLTPLEQAIESYTGIPVEQPEPPRTFVIECNKTLAQADGNAENPSSWTNHFPPIKLKKGDIVSVNSAFLSTRGGGDLLQFDETNNKTRLIFEYYQTNDNTNGKRIQYNIKGYTPMPPADGAGEPKWNGFDAYGGVKPCSMNCFPVDYRPMRMYRLMKTFEYIASTPTNGQNVPAFTNSSTALPYPKTAVAEPNWGWEISPAEIVEEVEDDYVPGLFRNPICNVRDLCIDSRIDATATKSNYYEYKDFQSAAIWYVSTQNSFLSPCNNDASMRIHFVGRNLTDSWGTITSAKICEDSLNVVKALRPGQYFKFVNPNRLFGTEAPNGVFDGSNPAVNTKGSNCYYASEYGVINNGGNMIDRFLQVGNNTDGKWKNNPMGMMMKVVRTYCGVSPTRPNGNNTVIDVGMSALDLAPWIEVQCDGAMSFAFGNPNYWEGQDGGGSYGEVPYCNQPFLIANANNTTCCPATGAMTDLNSIQLRVYGNAENNLATTTQSFASATENAVGSGAYCKDHIPESKYYLGFQPRYVNMADLDNTGLNSACVDQSLGALTTSEDFYTSTITRQKVMPTNYNLLTLNQDLTMSEDLKYGNDYQGNFGGYGGGRLPLAYETPNQQSSYIDNKYITATLEQTFTSGTTYSYQAFDNQQGTQATTTFLQGESNQLPVNNSATKPNAGLYMKNSKGQTMRCFIGNKIDNTSDGLTNTAIAPIASGTNNQTSGNAELASGIDNFITAIGDFEEADNTGDRVAFYGYPITGNTATPFTGTYPQNIPNASYTYVADTWDVRAPLQPIDKLCYVRMVDPVSGNSEVMYVQIIPAMITSWKTAFTGSTAYDNINYNTTTGGQPDIDGTGINTETVNRTNTRFFIIKRDIMGTGKVAFNGAYNVKNADLITGVQQVPDHTCAYFEIFNALEDIEYRFKFDSGLRELISTSQLIRGQEYQYTKNDFTTGADSVLPAGGDFVLTAVPNMPYNTSITNITHTTSSTINLIGSLIRSGDPDVDADAKSHTGGLSWDIHYDYKDITLDPNTTYFSVDDVSNEITKQLQEPEDLYRSDTSGGRNPNSNGIIEYSKGRYPANAFFRPIHGPLDSGEDVATGALSGTYHQGDFCWFAQTNDAFFKKYYNCNATSLQDINNNFYAPHGVSPGSGLYQVFPRNENTMINIAPSTNAFNLDKWTYRQDLDAVRISPKIIYNGAAPNQQGGNYTTKSCVMSQWAGTQNPTLSYNATFSRFEWNNLHQPLYNQYDSVNFPNGGIISAFLWTSSFEGLQNWDRFGGVNMVNWCSPVVDFGQYSTRRAMTEGNVLTEFDTIGKAFMKKLGFTDEWRATNSGHTTWADDDPNDPFTIKGYNPKGTTRSDYNISQATQYGIDTIYTANQEVGRQKVYEGGADADWGITNYGTGSDKSGSEGSTFNGARATGGSDTANDGFNWYGKLASPALTGKNMPSIGSVIDFGSMNGYGWGSTRGTPNDFGKNNATTGTGINTFTALNLDDIKLPYYSYQVGSSALRAPILPKKTDVGYFFIMSDIIDKHEFYASANFGSPINCIGILSKNYASEDFFFSFQSPVEFYIKKDKTITSINTRVLTPTMTQPIGLDFASSIIYTIVRPNNVPEPEVPPVLLQQLQDYAEMEQQDAMLATQTGGFGGYQAGGENIANASGTGGGNINYMRSALVQAALTPSPTQATALSTIQSGISSAIARMGAGGRSRMLQQGFAIDPSLVPPVIQNPVDVLAGQPAVNTVPPLDDPATDLEILVDDPTMIADVNETLLKKGRMGDDYGGIPEGEPEGAPPPYSLRPEDPLYNPEGADKLLEALEEYADPIPKTPTTPREQASFEAHLRRMSEREGTPQPAEASGGKPKGLAEVFDDYFQSVSDSSEDKLRELKDSGFNPEDIQTYPTMLLRKLKNSVLPELEANKDVEPETVARITSTLLERQEGGKGRVIGLANPPRAIPAFEYDGKAEGKGYQNPGSLSLYDAVKQTTYQTGDYNPERNQIGNWYNEEIRGMPKGSGKLQQKAVSNRKGGDENPFDLRTWQIGKLQSFYGNPSFHLKKGADFKDPRNRVSAKGMKQIYNELMRRRYDETGKQRKGRGVVPAVAYGNKEGEKGQLKKGYHSHQFLPHPNWTSDRQAHHHPRLTAPAHKLDKSRLITTQDPALLSKYSPTTGSGGSATAQPAPQ